MSELGALAAMARRDVLLAVRQRSDVATSVAFFAIVVSLFPLGLGADPPLLRQIGAGIIWVSALLACLLGLSRLFAADYADGSLEQLVLSPAALPVLVLGKVLSHWIAVCLPLIILAPFLGLQFGLPGGALLMLVAGLVLGTPCLSLIGAVGEALTLGLPRAAGLVPLLVVPLQVPVLILGAGAVEAQTAGLDAGAHLSLLGAYLIVLVLAAPWAVAAALRVSID
jgi:heme exporter protein B